MTNQLILRSIKRVIKDTDHDADYTVLMSKMQVMLPHTSYVFRVWSLPAGET
jgi:hypothetical protein